MLQKKKTQIFKEKPKPLFKHKRSKPPQPRTSQTSWSKTKSSPPICSKCSKVGHFSRECKIKEKINNLEIDESNLLKSIKIQLKILLLELGSESENSQDLENKKAVCVIAKE